MHTLYIFSVWVHILSATIWLGGMLFLVLVVVPWLRQASREGSGNRANVVEILRETGTRFRNVAWVCFLVSSVTGGLNLWARGVGLSSFTNAEWLSSPFGKTVLVKLGVFAVVLSASAVHDLSIGPGATAAMERDPSSRQALTLRRRASLLGRFNVVLALLLVFLGVMLVRGAPW